MVNAEYLEFLVNVCNEKMEENIRNIEKLNTVFVEKNSENDGNDDQTCPSFSHTYMHDMAKISSMDVKNDENL